MRTEPRRATAKAPSRNQPRQDPDPPHAETRRPHAAHHPGQGGNRRTDPGHGRERITRQATARTKTVANRTRGVQLPAATPGPANVVDNPTRALKPQPGRKNQKCPHITTPNSPPTCSQTSTTYTPKSAHYHAAAHNHSPSPNWTKPSSGQRRPPMKPNSHDDHINTADALIADAYFRFMQGPKHAD